MPGRRLRGARTAPARPPAVGASAGARARAGDEARAGDGARADPISSAGRHSLGGERAPPAEHGEHGDADRGRARRAGRRRGHERRPAWVAGPQCRADRGHVALAVVASPGAAAVPGRGEPLGAAAQQRPYLYQRPHLGQHLRVRGAAVDGGGVVDGRHRHHRTGPHGWRLRRGGCLLAPGRGQRRAQRGRGRRTLGGGAGHPFAADDDR